MSASTRSDRPFNRYRINRKTTKEVLLAQFCSTATVVSVLLETRNIGHRPNVATNVCRCYVKGSSSQQKEKLSCGHIFL